MDQYTISFSYLIVNKIVSFRKSVEAELSVTRKGRSVIRQWYAGIAHPQCLKVLRMTQNAVVQGYNRAYTSFP